MLDISILNIQLSALSGPIAFASILKPSNDPVLGPFILVFWNSLITGEPLHNIHK